MVSWAVLEMGRPHFNECPKVLTKGKVGNIIFVNKSLQKRGKSIKRLLL